MTWWWAPAGMALLFLLSLSPPGADLRRRAMARWYDALQARYERHMAPRKQRLLGELHGTLLELGPGTGANFPYLAGRIDRWIGLEPNPHMHARLREAARRHGIPAEFRTGGAEGIPVEDASVDAVLCTLVLCSIPDPAAALSEVRRVLRPGGRFVFLEHVAAPRGTSLRRIQRVLRPLWGYVADGCRPDRETATLLREAGFASLELEEFELPRHAGPRVIAPHVAGVARAELGAERS